MIKYKSYGKMPKKIIGVSGSFFNKPLNGLWGCRGEEWKEWCEAEEFCLNKLKHHFFFRLKPHSRILRIKNVKNYIDLCIKYGNLQLKSIDYLKVAEDYDAIEMVGDIVYTVRLGLSWFNEAYVERLNNQYNYHEKYSIIQLGLYAWDIPSICVLNPDKVILYIN